MSRRLLLVCIEFATAMAPLVGGMLIGHSQWQALFVFTAGTAFVLAALAGYSVTKEGRLAIAEEQREPQGSHLWACLAFVLAQAILQIVLQQVHFQLFTSTLLLPVLTLAALGLLAWFGLHQWQHPRPLMRVHLLQDRVFQMGLVLYGIYYYLTTASNYLAYGFIEGTLAYPVENTGRLIGLTSMVSLLMLWLYFRYSSLIKQRKWLIVPGFGVAFVFFCLMVRMPPDTSESILIGPLLLKGLLVMFIVIPVANLTFRNFELDDFSHSYRLKNIVRQLVLSFATSSIIVLEHHRQALHYERLAEAVTLGTASVTTWLPALQGHFLAAGHSDEQAHLKAMAVIAQIVLKQANDLAIMDGFIFLAAVALIGGILAIWQNKIG